MESSSFKVLSNILLFFILVFTTFKTDAQSPIYRYRIWLTDKKNTAFQLEHPSHFLSQRSLDRKSRFSIPIDSLDLPISPNYLEAILGDSNHLITSSRWLNSMVVETSDSNFIDWVTGYSFVKKMDALKASSIKRNTPKFDFLPEMNNNFREIFTEQMYGPSFNQTNMVQGDFLHNQGNLGSGVHIAVIDAGFYKVNEYAAFEKLRLENRLLGTKNFVDTINVFSLHSHGTSVLSIMAAHIPGSLLGSSLNASYWLLRTEDADYEYIEEEDYWVAAAEFADSLGIDLINSSLGYTSFDNVLDNHEYKNMDGKTTIISRGAKIAVDKGIFVVNSAGNSGNNQWKYIGAPADAEGVLAVGAVTPEEVSAIFSSRGPTYDKRLKPDVVAQGQSTVVLSSKGTVTIGSGTSFSSPLVAGYVACLLEAFPNKTNKEIYNSILKSASNYLAPDTIIGNGIPNFLKAYALLKGETLLFDDNSIKIFPNPFMDKFYLEYFSKEKQTIDYTIYNLTGLLVKTGKIDFNENDHQVIPLEFDKMNSAGAYILRISSNQGDRYAKILKMAEEN